MSNKLRIILVGVLLLCALVFSSALTLPASAATFSSATASHPSTVSNNSTSQAVALPQSQRDYDRGFRDGRFTADRECFRFRFQHRNHGRRESDYNRGFVDGFNFSLDHDRFCRHR